MPAHPTWTSGIRRKARTHWATRLPQPCPHCNQPIHPTQPWDIDHINPQHTHPHQILDPTNWRPAHQSCNRAAGARLATSSKQARHLHQAHQHLTTPHEPGRTVILICGPPGAGKTTLARTAGLHTYDRDDPQWRTQPNPETAFRHAIRHLHTTHAAQAVIIRSAPTTLGRADTIANARCTHSYVLPVSAPVLHHRIRQRGRADAHTSHKAVHDWWQRWDDDPHGHQLTDLWSGLWPWQQADDPVAWPG